MAADYRLSGAGVIRLSDGASIPPDPYNRDWLEHLAYIEAGGEVLPEPEQPVDEAALERKAAHKAARAKVMKKLGLTLEEALALFDGVDD